MQSMTEFETINQFSARRIIPKNALMEMVKSGVVPGFRAGNRYYINSPVFIKQLNSFGVVDVEELKKYIVNIPTHIT